ncbi:small integral membrane protein 26-like [Stigmatopora argus]
MTLKDITKWHKGLSKVYAVGVWTIVGSFAYFQLTGGLKDLDSDQNKEEKVEDNKDSNQIIYKTEYTKSVVIYKKDFVPYTTRIYNFIQSFTGGPGSGDGPN